MSPKEVMLYIWVMERGANAVPQAIWMTWYKATWPWEWVELDAPRALLHINWKSYVTLTVA